MTQPEFDFTASPIVSDTPTNVRSRANRAGRPHHRTTTLTTDNATYERVANLRPGEECRVEFVNDIISSAKGGQSVIHHPIRRYSLLRRQILGDYTHVKVRSEQNLVVNCLITGSLDGREDACSGWVTVAKKF